MGISAPNETRTVRPVRVKIIQCTSSARQCWYRKYIGEILKVDEIHWYKDGELGGHYFQMKETPDGGFNGHISPEDVEKV